MAMSSPTKTKGGRSPPMSPSGSSGIDVEAELGIQPVRRPMDIDQDVSELGQKKRVSSVLTSPMFKEELETVVTDLLRSGDGGGHFIAKEIVNMLAPQSMGHGSYAIKTGVGCVSPINDITGSDIARYTKGEKLARCKLAALYRLVDLNGWSQQIFNHISYKVDKEQEHFLINPFGLLYHEVSAAKLLKINMQGDVIDQGTTNFPINKPGFMIHSAIHSGRPDLTCVIHAHIPDCIAVSVMDCGLLPISQEACYLGDVSYHPYQGLAVDPKEKKLLIKHLGPVNKVMFMRNHGILACGETIEEAFALLTSTVDACRTQNKILSCVKPEKLTLLDKSIRKQVFEMSRNQGETIPNKDDPISWEHGEMMFEANMRMLDNMGYRTGYLYKNPTSIHRRPRVRGDVELPATAHGHTIPLDEIQEGRSRLQSHPPPSARWVNSNQYTKVRPTSQDGSSGPASVNGDVSPKSRPRWSREEGSSQSTPIRIADANQFVPKNTDPREVAEKRKQIRGQGKWEERGPGPQSQKLETFHHTERRGHQQDEVFTGSKGIIQRDYHAQTVVAGPPNPFASMSDDEIEKYKLEVTQKIRKDTDTEQNGDVNEESVEHTIEVVAHISEETNQENHEPTVLTNGHHEDEKPNDSVVQEEVVDSKPVEQPPPQPLSVNNNNKADIPVEKPEPAKRPEKKIESVEKIEEPQKKNGGDSAPPVQSPKVVQAEEPVKSPADTKNDGKGKHKEPKTKEQKKQKRRSLSFLKKNKEKKEKE